MTHAEIAAMIRQHAPGALPESVIIQDGIDHLSVPNAAIGVALLPDDIAEAVLIAAMVRSGGLSFEGDGVSCYGFNSVECRSFFPIKGDMSTLDLFFTAWKHAMGVE